MAAACVVCAALTVRTCCRGDWAHPTPYVCPSCEVITVPAGADELKGTTFAGPTPALLMWYASEEGGECATLLFAAGIGVNTVLRGDNTGLVGSDPLLPVLPLLTPCAVIAAVLPVEFWRMMVKRLIVCTSTGGGVEGPVQDDDCGS